MIAADLPLRTPWKCVLALTLFLAGGMEAAAQVTPVECEAAAVLEQRPDGFYFVVNGRSNLPDHAVLGLGIAFAGEIVPDAWRKADVVRGRFRPELGPLSRRLLSGYYRISILYATGFQYVNIRPSLTGFAAEGKWEISCYVGSPETEEIEDAEYRTYLREAVARTGRLYKDLAEHYERYTGDGAVFVPAEFAEWRKQWRGTLAEAKTANAAHGSETVLGPLYPDSVRDLTVITDFLDLVYLEYASSICRKNNLPIEAIGEGDHPPFTLMADEYVREASRRTESILQRLNSDPGTDTYALYRDLVEIDGLFRDLLDVAARVKAKPDELAWGPWHMRWASRLSRVASGFPRYAAGALAKSTPSLRDDLAGVATALTDFGNVVGASLPTADGSAPPEGVARIDPKDDFALSVPARDIRRRLTALFEIISAERRALAKVIEDDLKIAEGLRGEIEKHKKAALSGKEPVKDWETWSADWQARLAAFRDRVTAAGADPTFRFHFPEAQRCESALAQALAESYREHTTAVHGTLAKTYEERVKYFAEVADRMIARLRRMVEGAGK